MQANQTSEDLVDEARRQVQICNACRYCEGYCSVFPAINRHRDFASRDIVHLANLCHNCQGCFHACQYTDPHEFAINLPKALADIRVESWQLHIKPTAVARRFQTDGVAIAAMLVVAISVLLIVAQLLKPEDGTGFYAFISHSVMVTVFAPAFILPMVVLMTGLRRYWQTVGGERIRLSDWRQTLSSAATLKNMSGGQDQGCNYDKGDRFSNTRRWFHQATMYGFLLCFASTVSGTLLHYLFAQPAPYELISLPKLLGIPGGILLSAGSFGLAWLKTQADSSLGATSAWGGEMAFTLLLGFTGVSGLILYMATGTSWVPVLLAVHLGSVLCLFVLIPYSKMAHGFFRLAALVRDAQLARD